MKYFVSPAGSILGVENAEVLAQMESHPESYAPCDEFGNPLKTDSKPTKKAKKGARRKA